MNRVSIALVAISLVTSHLMAQRAGVWDGDRNAFEAPPVVARTIFSGRNLGLRQNLDGSVCFPPPNYQYCNYDGYNYYALDLYRLWAFYAIWNGMHESDPTQPSYTKQSPEPPPPPLPPATPVLREYNWPEQVNTAATFSIVTTSGTVYLATMVWVEGGNVHFNLVDGSVRQIPLSSVSRSLTETAKAPAASITIEPPMVEPGQPVTLKWSSTNGYRGAGEVRLRQLNEVLADAAGMSIDRDWWWQATSG